MHTPSAPPHLRVLDAAFDRCVSGLPPGEGLALRLEAPDFVWAQARGAGVHPAQTLRIASVTKTFVAAAVLRLVDQGRLGLDDPVGPLLPAALADALRADGYDPSRITVRMLLNHTAGLYDYAEDPDFQARVANDPGHVWTREEQVAFAMAHGDPLAAPGERFAYSDTGYVLLGGVIETITARPMAAAVRDLLGLDRLGLVHTWFETLEPAPRNAPGRVRQFVDALDVQSIHASADLFGGGGLISTQEDLARLFRALLGAKILRAETLAAMMQASPQSLASGGEGLGSGGYGMGLGLHTVDGVACYGHGGFWGVLAWHCPAPDLTVTGFVTNTSQRGLLAACVDDALRAAPGPWPSARIGPLP
jgi:D-alanyl-D-alanine carboxypeptidase